MDRQGEGESREDEKKTAWGMGEWASREMRRDFIHRGWIPREKVTIARHGRELSGYRIRQSFLLSLRVRGRS